MALTAEDIERYQRVYARTVIAHLVEYIVDKGIEACSLAELVRRYDSDPVDGADIQLGLEGNRRLDRRVSFRHHVCHGTITPMYWRGDDDQGNHLCIDGMPFFNTPEHVYGYVSCMREAKKQYGYVCPPFFSCVVSDPEAFLGWCRDKLAASSGRAGKKECTRFPKDPSLDYKKEWDEGAQVGVSFFRNNLADSYLLHWWDELVASSYAASSVPLAKVSTSVIALTSPISDPVKQNRKASAADVADYINKLVAAVRSAPVACGLMASGRRPDDPLVLMFVDQPHSLSRATGDFDSARHDSGWMDLFLSLLTNSVLNPGKDRKDYDESDGIGMPMSQLLGTMLDLAKEQAAVVKAGGQLELLPTKELVSRLHDAVTDPDTELAMEMSLVFTHDSSTHKPLRDLGRVALAMRGHEEFEVIRKTAMNRVKSTNESYFKQD